MANKASALLIVLVMVLIVVILANVALSLISSQSRLTHHQVSRIQAYYAAQAGLMYALEMLRTGAWGVNSCPPNTGGCLVTDNDFPGSIQNKQVRVIIRAPGSTGCINPPGNTACVSATTTYTYTAS